MSDGNMDAKKVKLSQAEIRALKKIRELIEQAMKINSEELGFYVMADELEQFLADVNHHIKDGYKMVVKEDD